MKRVLLSIVLLTLAAGVAFAEPAEGFLTDYATAQAQAKKENKPLFLHFTTDWCTWCRKIESDIYKTPEGKKILAPFVKATLDCTVPQGQQPSGKVRTYLQMMQKYGGQGYPFLVMTTPDGDMLGQIIGYLPMPQFKAEVDKALKNWELYKKIKACQAKGDTNSLEYHQDCLNYYLETQNVPKAVRAAEALRKLDPKGEKTDAAQITYALLHGALASEADLAKIEALRKDVAQADPKNEKGYLEKAYLANVMALMMQGQKKTPAEQQDILRQMVALLQETARKVPSLSNPMQVYGLLFQVQAKLGDFDGAIQSLEEFKKVAPDGVDMTRIDETIEQLKQAKQQTAVEAGPADAPKETPAE
ncbi:MAG: thioredoxin family protein [Phycisphaerae bacterium]|nr:thioredoxin family protein [Phycisphaerae bacterium]